MNTSIVRVYTLFFGDFIGEWEWVENTARRIAIHTGEFVHLYFLFMLVSMRNN